MLELTALLKEHHLKVTPQRLAIFKLLKSQQLHPSAEMIYKALQEEHPTMSLATVYKTLDTFVQHGLIQQLTLDKDSFRYDADISSHPHIQCTKCKKVYDLPTFNHIEHLENNIEKETGFELSHEQFYFYGVCPDCQKV